MKRNLSFSLAALALCVVQTVSAQRLLWENDFPIPAGYFTDFSQVSSAGDGSGGSVFTARMFKQSPPSTNFIRAYWLNKKGVAIATNDLQFLPLQPGLVSPVVRLTPRELVLHVTDGFVQGGFTNNMLRRIKPSGGGTVTVTDAVLSPTELVVRDTKTAADKLGFFTYAGSVVGSATNLVIRRYSNK